MLQNGNKSYATGVAFSSNSKYLPTYSDDSKPILWDLETGSKIWTWNSTEYFLRWILSKAWGQYFDDGISTSLKDQEHFIFAIFFEFSMSVIPSCNWFLIKELKLMFYLGGSIKYLWIYIQPSLIIYITWCEWYL